MHSLHFSQLIDFIKWNPHFSFYRGLTYVIYRLYMLLLLRYQRIFAIFPFSLYYGNGYGQEDQFCGAPCTLLSFLGYSNMHVYTCGWQSKCALQKRRKRSPLHLQTRYHRSFQSILILDRRRVLYVERNWL
jgi:hypothetical protein